MDNKERVLDYFKKSGEVLAPGKVAEALEMDRKEFDKILKALKDEGQVFSPKRCFYQIKQD